MGDKNGFQVDMSRGIVLENGYGYEHEFLKSEPQLNTQFASKMR